MKTQKGEVPKLRTKFLRLKCPSCNNEQNAFSAAAKDVRCVSCNTLLAKSGASKIEPKAKVVKVYS